MTAKQYDPKAVTIVVGTLPVSGFADGTFLRIEQNADAFSLQVGSDGEACRTRSNDNSATITLTLMQSSLANDLLSDLHALDKSLPAGAGCVPLQVKDLSGRSMFIAQQCWIKKAPAAEFGREAGPREWTLETDSLIAYHGGN